MKSKVVILAVLFMGSSLFAEREPYILDGLYNDDISHRTNEIIEEYDGILIRNVDHRRWTFYKRSKKKPWVFKSKRGNRIIKERGGDLHWDRKGRRDTHLFKKRRHARYNRYNNGFRGCYKNSDRYDRYHNDFYGYNRRNDRCGRR